MPSTHTSPSITFPVDDVIPADERLPTCKPMEAVRALLNAPGSRWAADESELGNPTHGRVEACWSYSLDCVDDISHNPLVAAAHLAFSEHRPLVLSPDVIWLTIAQGLAQHVRLNPEQHRSLLVKHQGKRELTVQRDDLHRGSPENPWAEVVASLADRLSGEVGEFASRLACDFSTTGPVERMVSQVVLLDVFQPYYSYNVVCVCGIPAITLLGTPADWRNLRQKVELLAPFGLDWWLGELRPICDQFVRASEGHVDRDHWRRIYKLRAVYGAEVINGWLGKLFPYTKNHADGIFSRRNDLLDPQVEEEIRQVEAQEARRKQEDRYAMSAPGIRIESLPRGLSQVPFTLTEFSGKRAMEFVAGSIAVTQNSETGALQPVLGWAVRESPPIEQALLRLAEHHLEPATGPLSVESLRGRHVYYIPTDVLRFYQVAASAEILGQRGVLFRIAPFAEWHEPEWAKKWRDLGNGERSPELAELYRFAEMGDGTEILIQMDGPDNKNIGAIFLGRRGGEPVPDTGRKIARSFTDFLLRALDVNSGPCFRDPAFRSSSEN